MKRPTRTRLLPLLLASALAAGRAGAATPSADQDVVHLDPFNVTADAQSEYGVSSLAGATVLNTPIREIPQSVSVLTKDYLNALGAVNMQDAMIWVSGVSPRQNVEDGTVIRSFLTTRTYNDGIRNFDGNYQSDLADFDRIEIIKGPAAAIIGTGEPGGYVNRVTKKPLDVAQGYAEVQGGSWDFYRSEFDSTGPVSPTVDYRTVFAYQNNKTDVVGQSQERTVFDPSMSWKPYANTSVLVQYEYQDAHDPWNFGQPFYSVGTGGTLAAPKEANFLFQRDLYQGQTFSGLNNLVQNMRTTVTQKINQVLEARVIANDFVGNVSGARTVMGSSTVNATTHDIQETQSYASFTGYIRTFNTQADLVATYDLGPVHNSTLFGAEYIWNSDHEQDFTGVLPNFDLIHPVYGLATPALTQSENQLQQTNQEGYFVQQQSKLFHDRLVLTAGIRYDRSWITTWNYLNGAFTRTTPAQENWVNAPRVGLTYALTSNLSAYAIWSQAQSPASQMRAFPSSATDFTILTVETVARLKEVGFKGDFWGGRATASASYFDQSQIGFFQNTVTSQGVAENIIVPGALVRGMEVDTVVEPTTGFWVISSFTHDFQYYNASTGVPTSVVPKDKVTTYVTYRLTKKLSVNAGGIYIGPQFSVNGAQIYKLGGQSEFNAGLRYNFNKEWSAGFALQNLTNKLFVTALVSTTSNSVAPDRNWKLTLIPQMVRSDPVPARAALPEHQGPLPRSLIDHCIRTALAVFAGQRVALPPFASWTAAEWDRRGPAADEIRDCRLGWDVTDFGSGEFTRIGRTLFTLRNGRMGDPRYPKPYAEKFILDPEDQRAPPHFHRAKREDIINRGGGNILVQLTRTTPDDGWSEEALTVQVDGESVRLAARGVVRLRPGQSLTIPPRTIHQFWAEAGTGWTVSGEVSSLCDDEADNFFFGDLVRFPAIIEDQPRQFYLCHEYPPARPPL